jgi:hypothetical protein
LVALVTSKVTVLRFGEGNAGNPDPVSEIIESNGLVPVDSKTSAPLFDGRHDPIKVR